MYASITSDDEFSVTDNEDIISYFTEAQCPALAYELHKLTGFSIGMLSSSPVGSPDYMGHIFVFDSDGFVIDIKGRRKLEDVRDEWYFCGYLHRFWNLAEFEYEMLDWDLRVRYNKDPKAKLWAKYIAELL